MSRSIRSNVEIPLLKAYLKSTPSFPDFVPAWVPYSSWTLFGVLTFLLAFEMRLAILGTALAGAIAYGYFLLLRTKYKATNDLERADEKSFAA